MTRSNFLYIPDYLSPILEALKRIFKYADDIDEVEFLKNTFAQDATIPNLDVLGDASGKLRHHPANFISLI